MMDGYVQTPGRGTFTADVPFGNRLGLDVVVHRVAAVLGSSRPLHVIGRVLGTTVRAIADEVALSLMCYIPFAGKGE